MAAWPPNRRPRTWLRGFSTARIGAGCSPAHAGPFVRLDILAILTFLRLWMSHGGRQPYRERRALPVDTCPFLEHRSGAHLRRGPHPLAAGSPEHAWRSMIPTA